MRRKRQAVRKKKSGAAKEERSQSSAISISKTWLINLPRWWKVVAAIVPVVGGLLAIVFALDPTLKPPGRPAEVKVVLSKVQPVPNVTLREFLQRPGISEKAITDAYNLLSKEDLDKEGAIIYFDVEAKGLEGETARVVWSMYDNNTGAAIGTDFTNVSAWPSNYIQIVTPSEAVTGEHAAWVPYPSSREGPFKVRLEIYTPSPDGTEVRRDSQDVVITPQQ